MSSNSVNTSNGTSKAVQGARFPFGLRPPSKGMTVFLLSVSALMGVIYRDRYKSKQVRERLIERVSHLANEILPTNEMPRKVTVYLTAPPGDGVEKSRRWFIDYVKPIFVAAALDYEVKEGREDGKVQMMVCEEIRKQRKATINGENLEDNRLMPGSPIIIKQSPDNGIVAVGRIAWREILNGMTDGCFASLEDKPIPIPAPTQTEKSTQDKVKPNQNVPKPKEDIAEFLADQLPNNINASLNQSTILSVESETAKGEFSLPLHLLPLGYIPQQNLLGWANLPKRIYLWANDYLRVEKIGEYAVQIALGVTREFEEKDKDTGIEEQDDWVKEPGIAQKLKDKVVLEERIARKLKVIS